MSMMPYELSSLFKINGGGGGVTTNLYYLASVCVEVEYPVAECSNWILLSFPISFMGEAELNAELNQQTAF